jgi:hypothetical protein
MKKNIYPFTVHSPDDNPSMLARKIWMRLKVVLAPDLIWYNVDLVVEKAKEVTLRVYDMKCPNWGGTGEKIFSTQVFELTQSEQELLDREITEQQHMIASIELAAQDAKAQAARVELLRAQMFDLVE